jgi:translation elongation factor EF-Ts
MQRLSKKLGVDLRVARFVRLQCGEGLADDRQADFAAEVAAMAS